MKLYGTLTSERASKGQGGNDKIEATFSAGDDWRNVPSQDEIWCKLIWNDGKPFFLLILPKDWLVSTHRVDGENFSLTAQKGKKQKAE